MIHLRVVLSPEDKQWYVVEVANYLLTDSDTATIGGPYVSQNMAQMELYNILLRTDCKSGSCGD